MADNIDTLKDQLRGLSTSAALVTLGQRYQMFGKSFIFDGQLYTIEMALKDIPAYLLEMPCEHFGAIRFYGGPPRNSGWYEGTVLTMLCDAVLFDENTQNLTESQLLAL